LAFLVYSKEQWKGGNRGNERGNEHNAKDTNETAVELLRSSVEAIFFFLRVCSRRKGFSKDGECQENGLYARSALYGRSTLVYWIKFACRALRDFGARQMWSDEIAWVSERLWPKPRSMTSMQAHERLEYDVCF